MRGLILSLAIEMEELTQYTDDVGLFDRPIGALAVPGNCSLGDVSQNLYSLLECLGSRLLLVGS